MRPLGALLLALLAWALAAACASDPRHGYSTRSTFPDDVTTVSVPVFENSTFDVGLEAVLTEAVVKELQRSTSIRVVQGGARANTVLRGVITGSEMRRLSSARHTGLVQEQGVVLTVDFEWRDERTGRVLVSRRNFSAADTFVASRPSGERLESGRNGAAQRLARDLVSELRSNW